MNRSETLRQSRDVYTIAWREFLITQKSSPSMLFCFFEGEDNKYYVGRIKPVLGANANIKPLVCGGKSGVLRVNSLWKGKYLGMLSPPACLFFVDRDFDSRSALRMSGMAYVTPGYSIENFYVSTSAIGTILENEFGVHTEEKLDKCIALDVFEDLLRQFLDASTLLNAWIFLHRKYESMYPAEKKLNLKNVKFNQLFSVSASGVTQLYTEHDLPALFPSGRMIDIDELHRYADWFRSMDRRKVCRGKYLIEFLRKSLDVLKTDRVCVSPKWFPKKWPVKLGLSRENIVSELCRYADTPPCLAHFLRQIEI